jgi:superfamily II DNA or RNA helicase
MPETPELRSWQKQAMQSLIRAWRPPHDAKPLVAASPGAGKTYFSVAAAKYAMSERDIELVIVVAPSINIKEQWRDTFTQAGIKAHAGADNEALRFRVDNGMSPTEDWRAICVTYAQLSRDANLFAEIARRKRTLVIADEVHHADDQECFGQALQQLAECAALRLALSGTPFNSSGGALAMCDSEEGTDELGRKVRKAIATHVYSYGAAITQKACRPAEFIKVLGKGTSTYRSLANDATWQKVIDLAKANKTDSIGPLLDPDGDFFAKMATDALLSLHAIKQSDASAGMLVVAKDKDHGSRIRSVIESLCRVNPEWSRYRVVEVYNDSPKAHDHIRSLSKDHTDIVITVRMISEGVDIKRLRVGLYATDYRTRMFFIQFVGRFIRWEDRLDDTQHARVVIPAHPDLIQFAREIEQMVDQATIPDDSQGASKDPADPKNEYLGTETEAGQDGLIWRGEETSDRALAAMFFDLYPSLRGQLPEMLAIKAARDAGLAGSSHSTAGRPNEDWSSKNDVVLRAIVRAQKMSGETDGQSYARINSAANRAVGIRKKDALTPVDVLKKRHEYLLGVLRSVRANEDWDKVEWSDAG